MVMVDFWFEYRSNGSNRACLCNFCTSSSSYNKEHFLKVYSKRGITFENGELVTLPKLKKVLEVVLTRLEEIHQPSNLQALCAGVIWDKVGDAKSWLLLPLPKSMRNGRYISDQMCHLETSGNIAFDRDFTTLNSKRLSGIIWNHVGAYIVRNRQHPTYV